MLEAERWLVNGSVISDFRQSDYPSKASLTSAREQTSKSLGYYYTRTVHSQRFYASAIHRYRRCWRHCGFNPAVSTQQKLNSSGLVLDPTWPRSLPNTVLLLWHIHQSTVPIPCAILVWCLIQNYPWSYTSTKLQVRVFPSQKAATTARYSDRWSHETASDVTGSYQIRLLRLCTVRASGIRSGTSTACAERSRSACS